jgi:microcystin-dependent protein
VADTVTVNYGWTKPEVGASATTWGTKLNADLDLIDAQVFANQTAIGAVQGGAFTSSTLTLNKATVSPGAYIVGRSAGVDRWYVALGDATSEGGSNAGSNLTITSYSDSGGYLGAPLSIIRSSGQVTVQNAPTTAQSVATKAYVDANTFVGEIKMFAGTTAPAGWLFCYGQAVSRTTYAALFAVIGTRFGAGDGSTTFGLPNLAQRVPLGWDTSSTGPYALGATGGEATHALSVAEMPSHNHPGSGDTGHTHSTAPHSHTGIVRPTGSNTIVAQGTGPNNLAPSSTDAATVAVNAASAAIVIAAQGGGAAHNNLQPYQVVGFIIRVQ